MVGLQSRNLEIWSISLLPLLLGPLWPKVIIPVRVLLMGEIKLLRENKTSTKRQTYGNMWGRMYTPPCTSGRSMRLLRNWFMTVLVCSEPSKTRRGRSSNYETPMHLKRSDWFPSETHTPTLPICRTLPRIKRPNKCALILDMEY